MVSTAVLFWLLALVTGVCAVAVVLTQNIVRAATWLLFALAGTAGIFFLLNANFVGATQLLVYVGGTLVLVVFGVMLTAQGPFIKMRIGAAEWAIALGVGLVLYGVIAVCLTTFEEHPPVTAQQEASFQAASGQVPGSLPSSLFIGGSLLGVSDVTPVHDITGVPGGLERNRQRVAYLLPFEIVSVHLLVVLIGAAYLARAKRRRAAAPVNGSAPEGGIAP